MASVELWHNFTFESQYQLLHGKFSQYPKEVQVEKTGIDFFERKLLSRASAQRGIDCQIANFEKFPLQSLGW